MKKNYLVSLNQEHVEALDCFLGAAGLARSAFINAYIVKVVDALDLQQIPDWKNVKVTHLLKMLSGVHKLMK